MREHLDAVLFDFDGTLVDSAPDFIDALNRLLSERGRPPVAYDDFRRLAGDGARRLLERVHETHGDAPAEEELAALVKRLIGYYYEVMTQKSRPFPGVLEILESLRAAEVALGVCTNKTDRSTRQLLAHFGLADHFGAVLCGDTVKAKKPDPLHLEEAMALLGSTAERTVMVGDSATDVKAARAAGVRVVAVEFGYSPVPATELGADAVIGHMAELPEAIRGLMRR